MAVKHQVVEYEERGAMASPDNVHTLLRIVEQYRQNPQLLSRGPELESLCQLIVNTLSQLAIPTEPAAIGKFSHDMNTVQEFLASVCAMDEHRDQLLYVVLNKLYSIISKPGAKPSAALSVVLNLLDETTLVRAVKLILDEERDETRLQQALHTLFLWVNYCSRSTNLGACIMVFIRGLEQQCRFGILRIVVLSVIDKIFNCMLLPAYRSTVGHLVVYMLGHMLDDPTAFHKVVPLVPRLAERLHAEGTQCAHVFALDVLNLCKALTLHFPGYDALYAGLEHAFGLFPVANDCSHCLSGKPWPSMAPKVVETSTGKVGLENLGNTCYLNSVLQALFMTKSFANSVLLHSYQEAPLLTALQTLFAMLQYSDLGWLAPHDLLPLLPNSYATGIQQDSSEFLVHLLETMHQQCEAEAKKQGGIVSENSIGRIVEESFGGRVETVYRCLVCASESARTDSFRELQLSFPSDFRAGGTVQVLLDYYFVPERLCGDNQYRCEQCAGLADADCEMRVVAAPPRLLITLKHFKFESCSRTNRKLLHRVNYDAEVQLAGALYELYATVIHSGDQVDSGHYFTYAKDATGWFKFNDTYVEPVRDDGLFDLPSALTPYILFYRRLDAVDAAPLPRAQLPRHVEDVLRRQLLSPPEPKAKRRSTRRDNPPPPPPPPPPPGCGGGGLQPTRNSYVC